VDDFAIACKEEKTATIIYDAIDFKLQIPIKRKGLLTLFNGLDVLQSRWYVKISVDTYLAKTLLLPYFNDWLDVPSINLCRYPWVLMRSFILNYTKPKGIQMRRFRQH
jgi:hypothetical protein